MTARERLRMGLGTVRRGLLRPVRVPLVNTGGIRDALVAAAPATFAFGIADAALGAIIPGGAVGDPHLGALARASAFAWEFLALAAGVATCRAARASLFVVADRLHAPRRLRLALRSLATAAAVVLAFAFVASWSMRWAAGTFLDGAVLDFVLANPGQLALHAATMNPLLLGLAPLAAPAAVLAARALRRSAERAPDRARRAIAAALAGSVAAAAGLAMWAPARATATVQTAAGARMSERDYLELVRDERTGPVLHAVTWRWEDERGSELAVPGAGSGRGVVVEQRPRIPVERWLHESADLRSVRRHSVIVLLVESLRRDVLRTFGGEREVMPALDAFARASLRFQGHYSQATHSDYADLAPLSSQHPLRSRRHQAYTKPIRYPRVLLYDVLKPLRYRTAIVSSQNEHWYGMYDYLDTGGLDLFFHSESARELATSTREDPGFDRWARTFDLAGKLDDATTVDRAIRWIGESDEPFFVYMNLQNSHFPYRLPPSFPARFSPHEVGLSFGFASYPPEMTPVALNRYHNALAYVDAQIARLLDFLRSSGRLDDTIVVVTGDTGQAFNEHGVSGHGGALYQEVVRVPLLVHAPGLAAGDVLGPSQHVDVPPTVLQLLGLPPFPGFQGCGLLGRDGGDEAVFLVVQSTHANQLGIVRGGYKLIYDPEERRTLLFDLVQDPGERRDLAAAEPERRAELASWLQAFARAQLAYYEADAAWMVAYPPVVRAAAPAPPRDGAPSPARTASR